MKRFGASPEQYFDEGMQDWPIYIRAFNWVVDRVVLGFAKLYWRWSIEGEPIFPPFEEGKVGKVYISNHASMLDPAIMVGLAGVRKSPLRPIYKSELDGKFLDWFFSRVGALPIRRGTADMKAIKRAVNALKRGENILIFPEGTRIWDPDERPEIFGGFAVIAQMAGADIVPIAVDGTERINPNKQYKLPRPSRVRFKVGKALKLSDMPGETKKEKIASWEKASMEAVYAMRAELRSGLVEG